MLTVDQQIIQERSEMLALVYLTRRHDLAIKRQTSKSQTDLLVSILENGRETGRCFGVEVKGIVSEQDILRMTMNRPLTLLGDQDEFHDIPVCLFLFAMLGDQGHWRWHRQPVLNGQQRELVINTDPTLHLLDNTEPGETTKLNEIIDAVNAWYVNRQALIAA